MLWFRQLTKIPFDWSIINQGWRSLGRDHISQLGRFNLTNGCRAFGDLQEAARNGSWKERSLG